MGAYLSEPNTEKYSSDEALSHLKYGASSMQGWRSSQEDAHNCILNFDADTSLFAVYDGHGGAEVAQYCSIHLPDYIKSHPSYLTGNMAQALEDAFLGFDATLVQDETIAELKQLASLEDQPSDADENEVNHLFAEANMPLDALLAKYKKDAPVDRQLTGVQETDDEKPLSPFLRAKQHSETGVGGNNLIREAIARAKRGEGDAKDDAPKTKDEKEAVATKTVLNGDAGDAKSDAKAVTPSTPVKAAAEPTVTPSKSTSSSASSSRPGPSGGGGSYAIKRQGGISAALAAATAESSSEEEPEEQEESSEEDATYVTRKQRRKPADSDDDDDESDGDDEEAKNSDDDEESEEAEEEEDEEEDMAVSSGNEVPGADSGCTAVVALLRKSVLYVANAGDSRCIVSRKGKAIDMSVDHKPEDELELKRIQKAGGKVTADGRVNGGLNLSRALGDHTYKKNEDVPAKEQMISALPDIRTLTIDPTEDEFMVLACDGIWNYMSSQEVADFVRERLNADGNKKLSSICEELFDVCLAPSTHGDGTGCDNMTAIIVSFDKGVVSDVGSGKRSLEADDDGTNKRQKSQNGESDKETTTT